MKHILIAGDSWGVGVYTGTGDNYRPTGEGIQSILESQGYYVTNISKAGDNNTNIADRIHTNTDKVIFIQTDAFREHSYFDQQLKILRSDFIDSLVQYSSLLEYFDEYFNNLYQKLNNLNLEIICVGGWSQLHPSINNYKNLINAIPSATKLILPELKNDTYLSDFEWFSQLNCHDEFMNKHGLEIKHLTVDSSNKFDLICRKWNDVHPNLTGYEILAKKIQEYLLRHK